MKRPFAVIGFSMLAAFLVITNITHKTAIVLLIGAVAFFCAFIIIKPLRRNLVIILALFGVIIFTISFISMEKYFLKEAEKAEVSQIISGVVCETPRDTDYAFTYIVKIQDKNYKVRFVAENDHFISQGDYVEINTSGYDKWEEDGLENSLSSKVFFTIFESDENTIEKTGEINRFYKSLGAVKQEIMEIIMSYLPGRNGAMAIAMTIGDKEEIDKRVIDSFNYSGTSHLLVISGLHLTIWSLGIMKILNRFSKPRKYSSVIGIICLVLYSAITGFSVSVIRAGTMVGAVLLGRFFNHSGDNINSIGVAVTFILLVNPFAPYSLALWLSVLSTLGLLVYSGKVQYWLKEKAKGKFISKIPFYEALETAISISFSTSVFTLPVFIFKLKTFPIASILANFIMVNSAMIFMIATVLGVIFHITFLQFLSRFCFLIAGGLGEFMHITAEKIGMADWSTISLKHCYYKYFFVVLIIAVVIAVILKSYKIDIIKPITVLFTILFCFISAYCTSYDYNTPSVEVGFSSQQPIITVYSKGESMLVGLQDKKYVGIIKDNLNIHNEKSLDYIVVTENDDKNASRLINLYYNFGEYVVLSNRNLNNFKLSENVSVDVNNTDLIKIASENKNVIVVNCKNTENVYENVKNYDIIILYNDKMGEFKRFLEEQLKNSRIITLTDDRKVSLYL